MLSRCHSRHTWGPEITNCAEHGSGTVFSCPLLPCLLTPSGSPSAVPLSSGSFLISSRHLGPRAASVSLGFLPAGVGVLLATPSRGQSCGGGCQRWERCRVSEGNGVESSGPSLFCGQAPHLFSGSPWIMASASIEVCCELPSSKAACVSFFRPPRIGPPAHLIEETVSGGRPAQAVTHLTWAFALTDPLPGTSSAFM